MTVLLAIFGGISLWIGCILIVFGIADAVSKSKLRKKAIAGIALFIMGLSVIIYITGDSLEVVETDTFITNNYEMYELPVDSEKLGTVRMERLESTRFGLDTKQIEYYFEGFVEE